MLKHEHARRAVVLLMILAAAFWWTGDQRVGAAGDDRAEKSAPPAKAATATATETTVKDPPPSATANETKTAAPAAEPAPAAAAAPQSGKGKPTRDQAYVEKFKKIAPSLQKEAAKQARLRGLKPGVAGLAKVGIAAAAAPLPGQEGPGGIPHYFGPYANWAFSPLPRGPVTAVTILAPGTGYTNPIIVIDDAYGTGTSITIPTTAVGGAVQPPRATDLPAGADFTAPVATVVDDPARCGGALQPACGTGALADAIIGAATPGGPLSGGMRKFVDGLPLLGPGGANNLGQYIPIATPDTASYRGSDYYEIALVEYTEQMHSDLPGPCTTDATGVTTCGGTTPGTRMRGYVQLSTAAVPGLQVPLLNPDGSQVLMPNGAPARGVDKPHFLGPLIVAQGRVAGIEATNPAGAPRPVRIKFYNLLPSSAAGGNLLLPVDETVPGAGAGPAGGKYPQNRATIHLHGNNTVWISDGNTHQWVTPASETSPYPAGVSARNVPDMGTGCDAVPGTGLPGNPATQKSSGCMTFYYTNAQSARLQFYHDHAHGITRLNVYAGEAAGYVITDAVEQDMINGTNVSGVNPGLLQVLPGIGIPLVIQDKTWVDPDTIYAQDPTWAWGSAAPGTAVKGDLWYPHVYMVVSNPYDPTGTNPFGRWFYGPWFNPPTPVCSGGLPPGCIDVGLVPNEYFNATDAPWEPPLRPGTPNPSIPGESFVDTPIVNGTAYPVLKVEPKAYRFRILNAANDRAQNLQLYVAADKTQDTTATALSPASLCDGTVTNQLDCTEVRMVPVSVAPANQFADTPSGIPDPTTAGPPWIQIGTEGGFMPEPVVVPQQPIGFNMNTGQFNFSIVNQHSLYLMAAERADVVVDFGTYAGKTLILYNDAPAPVPAGAAVYDFYTGDGNQMDGGGAPNTLPGYGPNTRTIMQIQVGSTVTTPTTGVSLANLQAVFAKAAAKRGVFEVSQDPILIPQAAYNSAYNQTFPSDASQFVLSPGDVEKTFQPLGYDSVANAWNLQPAVTIPFEFKAMHDEMGGVYDTGFGRMSGMLGLTNPNSALGFILPFPFSAPPTDVVKGSLEATPIGTLVDGTQLWRIFHNGVDTHPIHTHLFTAQIISRVGQDGQVASGTLAVDPSDLGWKDTFKVNPLEITFLALRPTVPTPSQVPFDLPNSVRLIDPTLPAGAVLPAPGPAGWFDPLGTPIATVLNHTVNFGWEYVWHCHILSHEEMDFMHSLVFAVPPAAPTKLKGTVGGNPRRVTLTWTNNSARTDHFRLERAETADFTRNLKAIDPIPYTGNNSLTYVDSTVSNNRSYWYRVWAVGQVVGDTTLANFPTKAADSVSDPIAVTVGSVTAPVAPSGLIATGQPGPQVSLTWTDNATTETGFVVERCTGTTCTTGFVQIAAPGPRAATGSVTYVDATVTAGNSYGYRVKAVNGGTSSAYTTIARATVLAPPAAATGFTVTPAVGSVTCNWLASAGAANYTVQRATNATFTKGVTSVTASAPPTTITGLKGTYYFRIRANNAYGSSAWTNGSPFPVIVP